VAERLSASDMSSLLAERGPIHVNVGATMIMQGKAPDFEALLAHVDKRLGLVPRFRQKIKHTPPPIPGRLPERLESSLAISNPVWVDDPAFDIRWHVRHLALPKPGTMDQLKELVGWIMSQSLDFSRPLWQICLIEGLEGRRHAYVPKTHHALVDGVSALDVGTILLDPNPDGTEMPVPEGVREPDEPSSEMLFVRAASDRIREPLRLARQAATRAMTMPRKTATEVRRTAESFAGLAAGGPKVPASPLNVEIGRDRRVAYVKTELARLKQARGDSGATLNDVILAVATGGLACFLEGRGEPAPEHLVALVPVSIRKEDEKGELGNRISTIFVKLPLAERDPAARLELIREETARLKASADTRAAALVIEATGWAPPTINRVLAGAMSRPLTWNLVVSNVPGPQVPFYLLGRQMREVYPFVPLSPQGHALSIGLLSYDGGVFFGLVGDRDVMADLEDMAAALEAALEEQAPLPVTDRRYLAR
jgi:diacylglycerol O-acyltransferase / wax synthase